MDRYDDQLRYCRMLGHDVNFRYCRSPGSDVFCRNITGCWGDRIKVGEYIQEFFTEEQQRRGFAPPTPKITRLVDLVERAKAGQ